MKSFRIIFIIVLCVVLTSCGDKNVFLDKDMNSTASPIAATDVAYTPQPTPEPTSTPEQTPTPEATATPEKGYNEVYKAVAEECEKERPGEIKYDLIYFNDDDIPELVAGLNGFYMSMYTYKDGEVYTLMDQWVYGAMGNSGYAYSPRKNSLRNYNADFAGAILYTSYMAMNEQFILDTVAFIETYNFNDVNKNGYPDEDEQESLGMYSISYMNGEKVEPEDWAVYDAGDYEWFEGKLTLEELKKELDVEK